MLISINEHENPYNIVTVMVKSDDGDEVIDISSVFKCNSAQ